MFIVDKTATENTTHYSKKKYEQEVLKLKIKLWFLKFNSIGDKKSIKRINGRVEAIWKLLQSILAKSSGNFVQLNRRDIINGYKYNKLYGEKATNVSDENDAVWVNLKPETVKARKLAAQEKMSLENSYLKLMTEENVLCDSLESLIAITREAITTYLVKCNADTFEHQIFTYEYKITDYYVELFAHN